MEPDNNRNKYQIVIYILGLLILVGLLCWFLGQIHMIINILVVSILVTYLISPGVSWLHQKGIPKTAAIAIVYIVLIALISFFVAYLLPIVKLEFHRLISNMSTMSANLSQMTSKWCLYIQSWLPSSLKPIVNPEKLSPSHLVHFMQNNSPSLVKSSMPGFLSGMRSMASIMGGAILVPLLVFYILIDAGVYKESFVGCLPKKWRPGAVDLLRRIDYVLGKFICGQLIVCITIGFFVGLSLWIMGIDYAVLIGVFSGIIDIIPYVGVAISYIPAFIIALLNKGPLFAIFTIIVLQAVHWLEGHIIVPAVIGRSVKLPPLTVMVALIAGAELGGIMGMLVAIPLAAIARVIIEFYVEKNPAFGPLTEEDMRQPDTPYPPEENGTVSATESVKQIVNKVHGKVQGSKRLVNKLRNYGHTNQKNKTITQQGAPSPTSDSSESSKQQPSKDK
ncbi:MAG: AI-2E family transporter [Candidatus Bruticola sp.]